jgi:hypothetical protein
MKINMTYPTGYGQTSLYLSRRYTIKELARAITRQTALPTRATGRRISVLARTSKTFTITIPAPLPNPAGTAAAQTGGYQNLATNPTPQPSGAAGTTGIQIPKVTITPINGYWIITGPNKQYWQVMHMIKLLRRPAEHVRCKVWLINDSKANNVDLTINGLSLSLTSLNAITASQLNAVATVLHQSNAIIDTYAGTLYSGQQLTYTDLTQLVLTQYSVPTGNTNTTNNNVLSTGLTTRNAGLTINLTGTKVGTRWVINGSISLSSFLGGTGNPLAPEAQQLITFQATGRTGDTLQVCRATVGSAGKALGLSSNVPELSNDHSQQTFSLWVTLRRHTKTRKHFEPHLLPRSIRIPLNNEVAKLFRQAEGKPDPKKTTMSK